MGWGERIAIAPLYSSLKVELYGFIYNSILNLFSRVTFCLNFTTQIVILNRRDHE